MNVSNRKDRVAMAAAVLALAIPGWDAVLNDRERKPDAHPIFDKRRIDVRFKGPRGLSLTVEFNGEFKQRRQDCFVLSWHGVEAPHKLAETFAPSVNPYHWTKATDVCSFEGILTTLPKRFAEAVSGAAFQEATP